MKSDAQRKLELAGKPLGVAFSLPGLSHLSNHKPCQDASLYIASDDKRDCLIAVADGHGGEDYDLSHVGSRLAVETARDIVKALWGKGLNDNNLLEFVEGELPDVLTTEWLRRVNIHHQGHKEVTAKFSSDAVCGPIEAIDDLGLYNWSDAVIRYGTTLLFYATHGDHFITFQIGDGAIYMSEFSKGQRRLTPLSEQKLTSSETLSLSMTEAARFCSSQLHRLDDRPHGWAMICSDGIEDLYLDQELSRLSEGTSADEHHRSVCAEDWFDLVYRTLPANLSSEDKPLRRWRMNQNAWSSELLPKLHEKALLCAQLGSRDDVSLAMLWWPDREEPTMKSAAAGRYVSTEFLDGRPPFQFEQVSSTSARESISIYDDQGWYDGVYSALGSEDEPREASGRARSGPSKGRDAHYATLPLSEELEENPALRSKSNLTAEPDAAELTAPRFLEIDEREPPVELPELKEHRAPAPEDPQAHTSRGPTAEEPEARSTTLSTLQSRDNDGTPVEGTKASEEEMRLRAERSTEDPVAPPVSKRKKIKLNSSSLQTDGD